MAKKSKKNAPIFLVAALLGVVAIAMLFFPMLKGNVLGAEAYFTGFNMIFASDNCKTNTELLGKTITTSTKFVIVPLIIFICSIVGTLAALAINFVEKKNKMIVKVVAFVCFVAAAVLAIALTKTSFMSANEISDSFSDTFSLMYGAYLVLGANALAGLVTLIA